MEKFRWRRPPAEALGAEDSAAGPEPVLTEAEYLQELAHGMRPVAVHLRTGEVFHGVIEYYDQRFIRLTRKGEPNLFIFKHDIKYFCED
jgi:host factor-I protein